jgi:hypothetical protein
MAPDVAALESARERLGLSLRDLWLRCLGLGGLLTPVELTATLAGQRIITSHEYDVVAQALNERFMDDGSDHPVPYADGS